MDRKDKKRWTVLTTLLLVCIIGLCFLLAKSIHGRVYKEHLDIGIPRMNIELNGVTLDEIKEGSKETKYEGNELELYSNNQIYYYNDVDLKGRGNMTWWSDKKPYQISFPNTVDLLGLGKAKRWVLLANYHDQSFLRNDVALKLAEMLGVNYSHRGKFVELYFDDEYEGLYYVVQRIEIGKGSVNLRNKSGVLFEIDTLHRAEEDCYDSFLDDCLVFKDAVEKDPNERMVIIGGFLSDYQKIEKALKEGRFEEVSDMIDLESFAKYYLVNEFTVNPDAYTSSFFLYRNDNGKISAGPVWDFDCALGNREWIWQEDDSFFSPYEDEKNMNTTIVNYLLKIPEFQEEVARIFQEKMMGRENELVDELENIRKEIRKAGEKDSEKWGIIDFESEINSLLDWVGSRYQHFESKYSGYSEDLSGQKHFQFL